MFDIDSPVPTEAEVESEGQAVLREEPRPSRPRLAFGLTDAGAVDFEAMRSETRQRIIAALAHPDTQRAIGVREEAQNLPLGPEQTQYIYVALGEIEVQIARLLRIPEPVARRCFSYTQQEIEILSEPTARVFNRYATGWLREHSDLAMLLLILVSLHQRKLMNLRQLLQQEAQKEAA
jgi:hypothetical protein